VPTRNEVLNVEPLVTRLEAVLGPSGSTWEVVFVDDSDDGTPQAVAGLARKGWPARLVHRATGERPGGLGGAVSEGFAVARGQVVVVMDADLQHPPEALPALIAPVLSGEVDLAAGSRYGAEGSNAGLAGPLRHLVSKICRNAVHVLVPQSRRLEDPLSGLFAFRRSILDGARLRPSGYKILLEVLVRCAPASVGNMGFDFAERNAGTSKASLREGLVFLGHLGRLVIAGRCRAGGYRAGGYRAGAAQRSGSLALVEHDQRRASHHPELAGDPVEHDLGAVAQVGVAGDAAGEQEVLHLRGER